jgi:hypothetical protein
MKGQMCWISNSGIDGEKILYLRLNFNDAWTPYSSMPKYSVPDYRDFPNGSKGWATFQRLLKVGWKLIPYSGTDRVELNPNYSTNRFAS